MNEEEYSDAIKAIIKTGVLIVAIFALIELVKWLF